ncbi:hypothetical protein O6H91_Y373800 [Diphasiastrum complanatum]|nr:hypothetical protein O6H91_Y373800 [Diphasiastrum complanatum]
MYNPNSEKIPTDDEVGIPKAFSISETILEGEEYEECIKENPIKIEPVQTPFACSFEILSHGLKKEESDSSPIAFIIADKKPSDVSITSIGSTTNHQISQTFNNQMAMVDNFEFRAGDSVSRKAEGTEQPTSMKYFKSRIPPGLVALTLPLTPDENTHITQSTKQSPESDSDSEDNSVTTPPVMKRSMAPRLNFGRLKTRLQDPPPMTPAVRQQISFFTSSVSRRMSNITRIPKEEETISVGIDDGKQAVQQAPRQATPASTIANPAVIPLSARSTSSIGAFDEDDFADQEESHNQHKLEMKRTWFTWVQWISLCLLITLLICSVKIKKIAAVTWLGLNLWRWQALALVIFSGRLVSGWAVKLFVAIIENHCLLKKRVLYFVYGLRRSVKNCIWLALVLVVWEVIFTASENTPAVPIITKILWCFFTIAVSWMVKVLAVKVAANCFHRAAYFERIQDCLFNQYLLETLSAPSKMSGQLDPGNDHLSKTEEWQVPERSHLASCEAAKVICTRASNHFPNSQLGSTSAAGTSDCSGHNEHKKENELGNHSFKSFEESKSVRKFMKRTRSPFPTPRLERISYSNGRGTQGQGLDSGSLHFEANVSMNQQDFSKPALSQKQVSMSTVPLIAKSPLPIEQDKLQQLTSQTVSAWTLKRLMKVVRNSHMTTYSSMLSQETDEWQIDSEVEAKAAAKRIFYNMARPGQKFLMFKDFLYFLPEDQATMAFSLFEITERGTILKRSLTKWVVNAFKERRALALTLCDNRTVVAKLHRVLDVVLAVTLFIVCLLIFGVNTSKLLVFFSTIFIPSVFVFGNTAKNTFEALIFLFIVHPYDVGDRISVEGQIMLVEVSPLIHSSFKTFILRLT